MTGKNQESFTLEYVGLLVYDVIFHPSTPLLWQAEIGDLKTYFPYRSTMAPCHTFRDEHYGVAFNLFLQFTSPRPRFPPHPSTYCTPRPPFGTLSPCRFDTFSYNRVWASFMPCHYVSLFDLGMRILTSSSERPRSSGSPKSKGPPDAFGWTSGWARLLLKLAYSYFSSKILQSGEDIWLPITRVESETIQCCSVAQLMLYSSFQMYFNTIY